MLVLSLAFLVLYIVFKKISFLYIAVIMPVVGIFFKRLSLIVTGVWLRFSHIIGGINSKIILTAIFFVVLTPISVIYRIFTKNPLMLKRDKDLKSMYVNRGHTFTKGDMEKMW